MPSTRITFRCSESLRHQAQTRAEREGESLSIALRALLSDYAAGRLPSLLIAQRADAMSRELRAIGVNLNQATRALNSGTYPKNLLAILTKLTKLLMQLRPLLQGRAVPHRP